MEVRGEPQPASVYAVSLTVTQQPKEGGTVILHKLSGHTAGMWRQDSYPALPGLEPMLFFCPLLRKQRSKFPRSTLVLTLASPSFLIFLNRGPKEKKHLLGAPSQMKVAEGSSYQHMCTPGASGLVSRANPTFSLACRTQEA